MYCVVSPAPVIAIVPELVTGDPVTVNAAGIVMPIDVTVPTFHVRSALKSYATPLIVNCLDVGTAPTSVAVTVDHCGAALVVPSPVCDKNILVAVMFGDLLTGNPPALE